MQTASEQNMTDNLWWIAYNCRQRCVIYTVSGKKTSRTFSIVT